MLLLHAKQIRKNAVAHELKLNSMASICLSCRGYGSVYFDIQLSVQTSTSSTRCILSVYIDKQWHNKSLHKVVKGVVQHACVQVMTHSACILASCLCFVTSFCLAPSAGAYGWHVQSCCSQLRNPKSAVSFASSLHQIMNKQTAAEHNVSSLNQIIVHMAAAIQAALEGARLALHYPSSTSARKHIGLVIVIIVVNTAVLLLLLIC